MLVRGLLLLILGSSVLLFAVYFYYVLSGSHPFNDFFVFWAAARDIRQAPLATVYDPAAFGAFKLEFTEGRLVQFPFLYPPSTALLFWPFGLLPLADALAAWSLLSLAVFLSAVGYVLRPRPSFLLAALVAPATVINLLVGQTGLFTGGLALFGFALLRTRPLAAGALLGLLALKPQLALIPLLALPLSQARRATLSALATVMATAAIATICFGSDAWKAWFDAITGFSSGLAASQPHQQYGITPYFALLGLGVGSHAAIVVQAVVSLGVLCGVAFALRRGIGPMPIAAALIGMFLGTPYAVAYDLPAGAAVCLMVFTEGRRNSWRNGELFAVAAAWCVPFLLMFSSTRLYCLAPLVFFLLFGLILRRIQTTPTDARQATAVAH